MADQPTSKSASKRDAPAQSGKDDDVVRRGGIAGNEAEMEDVTRDTYGFPSGPGPRRSRAERLAEANRAAEEAGMPGVEIPEESPDERKK